MIPITLINDDCGGDADDDDAHNHLNAIPSYLSTILAQPDFASDTYGASVQISIWFVFSLSMD